MKPFSLKDSLDIADENAQNIELLLTEAENIVKELDSPTDNDPSPGSKISHSVLNVLVEDLIKLELLDPVIFRGDLSPCQKLFLMFLYLHTCTGMNMGFFDGSLDLHLRVSNLLKDWYSGNNDNVAIEKITSQTREFVDGIYDISNLSKQEYILFWIKYEFRKISLDSAFGEKEKKKMGYFIYSLFTKKIISQEQKDNYLAGLYHDSTRFDSLRFLFKKGHLDSDPVIKKGIQIALDIPTTQMVEDGSPMGKDTITLRNQANKGVLSIYINDMLKNGRFILNNNVHNHGTKPEKLIADPASIPYVKSVVYELESRGIISPVAVKEIFAELGHTEHFYGGTKGGIFCVLEYLYFNDYTNNEPDQSEKVSDLLISYFSMISQTIDESRSHVQRIKDYRATHSIAIKVVK